MADFLPNFSFKPFTGIIEQVDDNDVDPTVDVGIKPTEENKEEDL